MGTPGQSRIERRLTAIMAADIAGYSRLMGVDEVGTARALREHRAAVDPIMASHGGRIVKTTGDGVLAEFPSSLPRSSALSRFRSSWPSGMETCPRIGKCGSVSASILGTY
jgi:class 3 adenylate cyclase